MLDFCGNCACFSDTERVWGFFCSFVFKHYFHKSFAVPGRLSSMAGKEYPSGHESFELSTCNILFWWVQCQFVHASIFKCQGGSNCVFVFV